MKKLNSVNRLFVKTRLWFIGFMMIPFIGKAAPPNWTVVPSQFQYNMSVTAVLNIDCMELSSDSNMLGAFVNGVCRGVVKTNTTVAGHRLAFLTVYSNSSSGETVQLKFYNVRADSVCTSKVVLTFTDNAQFGTNNTPIVVRNNDAPTSLSLSVTTIQESDTVNQAISAISCVDPDVADTHTYTLVNGAGSNDNAKLKITGSSLVLNAPLNYYVQDSLQIRIRSTDNRGCFYEQAFIIHITHVNHPPYAILISDSTLFDHKPVHTFVGLLSALDPDHNETFTYALTAGAGDTANTSFSITGDSLFAEASFDYLIKKQYSIRVRVYDHALAHVERPMTILIKNLPDAATDMALSANKIYQALPAGTFIGKLTSTDDIVSTYTYGFSNTGPNDNASFKISNDSLMSNAVFDYETKNQFHVLLSTTNSSGLAFSKAFTILVRDTLDFPTGIKISDSSIFDHKPVHSLVGLLSSIDKDTTEIFTYALVAGVGDTNNVSFSIKGDSLFAQASFDWLVKKHYTIRVRTTDAQLAQYERPLTILVKNSPDPPTAMALSNNRIYQHMPGGTFIGKLTTTDDYGLSFTYSFSNTGTNDNASFQITNDSLESVVSFDFETKNLYHIYVTTTDSIGLTYTKAFSIQIRDTLDAPNDVMINNAFVSENLAPGALVGVFSTADSNAPGTPHIYSLVSGAGGTDNAKFKIAHDSLLTNARFDFETRTAYSIRARTSLSNGLFVEKPMTINITEGADTIKNILISNDSIYENSSPTTVIGQLKTVSQDTSDKYTYQFDSSVPNDNASFSLTSSGLLSAAQSFDYDVKSSYVVSITSSNVGGTSFSKQLTIKIRDTLDVPTGLSLSDSVVADNKPAHTYVGRLSTADENKPTAVHTYNLVTGTGSTDNSGFVIGHDSLFTNAVLDYGTKSVLSTRIRTTLINNMSFERVVTILLAETADTIQNITLSNDSIYENSAPTAFIGKFTTLSKDTLDNYTYSFDNSVSSDNVSFSLTTTGLLSAAQSFDFDVKSKYTISVQSVLTGGVPFVKQFTIKIRDTLDVPTGMSLTDSLVVDNKPAHTFIGKFSTVDENGPLCKHTYSLVGGTGSVDDSSFVVGHDSLYIKNMADFEAQSVYHLRIRSTLINGMNFEKAYTVYVTSGGEKPHAINDSVAVKENSAPSYVITASARDSDSHVTFTYNLLTRNVPFAMDSLTGKVSLTGPLNFHVVSRYWLTFLVHDDNNPMRSDTGHIIVTVMPVQEAVLPINNYVSPNGDGKNDKLVIMSVEVYTDYQLTIYNTNGIVVYQSKTYDNSWDGQGLDAGVYYYTFYGTNKYKGSITLVK